ncbi:FAD-dependent oxidoreductase [Microbacterium dextranolyticum]|uniref:FAD-binding dehydrogenase n=1 Tax=Microbacterium dextranolyticum TaxID=36806 RepID=A0A9W6M617_9MICO|nr:FAD-dependent oxidoreductase [Microbacterium dextranolyticum]MBM7464165.1 succinate dehydrogenase/fumarate reductase flavoprotein subunit [Microbacterium dextranolyticum]GLJ95160.1 FAD-binding dehydrogenase [Microbacterium dextranolyticum]
MAQTDAWDRETDLLVLGTGAAGLSAAVTAAASGLDVLVLEKTEYLGGTTAYSAGTCWVPGHRHQRAVGATHEREDASRYLDGVVGDKAPRELREAYLDSGPDMIDWFDSLGVRFWHSRTVVDYHPEIDGAGVGRALEPETFDGRLLGAEDFRRVRPPVPEFALFGGTLMVRRAEVNQLLELFRWSPRAAATALRLGIRWFFDRLRHPRGTRLAMGNALVANLFHTLKNRGGRVLFNSTATRLVREDGVIVGAIVESGGRELRVRARRGVVLAGGGFAASAAWRAAHLPHPTPQFTRAAEGATGSTLELGLDAGAVLGPDHDDNGFWFPSSIGRRRDGSLVVFPHIWDRAKPGIVAVTGSGRRFVDESVSYHRFVRAMYAAQRTGEAIPAWLIIDSRALHEYGLGMIRPHTARVFLRTYVADGYIRRADTIAELARRIGVDPAGLAETVRRNNHAAETGVDEEFGKGTSPFGHQYGDARHQPNVNLGPIATAPFYALPLVPTPLGTARGLRTDTDARVLDENGAVIRGLYAAGNDADSVMAAEYPGAGGQVGAGMIFGYLAARHASGQTVDRPDAPAPSQVGQ